MLMLFGCDMDKTILSRAQGCLLGQLAGDSLGSLVEFKTPEEILQLYPQGVQELADGGTWNLLAGQPTDDSEMALLLARLLVKEGRYDAKLAIDAYSYWLSTAPFDCGMTILKALHGSPNNASQANGALMRISPLGIFGAKHELEQVREWAIQDAYLTHTHPICQQANVFFAMGIAHAIATGCSATTLYETIARWANELPTDCRIKDCIKDAVVSPPKDYISHQGWVLIAFHNALYQLLHAKTCADGIKNTVMQGGDTDTNAAICGALLGAVYGIEAIPSQWSDAVLNCRADERNAKVHRPRPKCFWPIDALTLAEQLVC